MTLRYRFLNDSKEWVVVGPARELHLGSVLVTKMNGEPKTETITRLSKTYNVDGTEFRFGYLRSLPKKSARHEAPLPTAPVEIEQPPDVPDAVLDLVARNDALAKQYATSRAQLVRLLNYVMNMREDYADLQWPELPDTYSRDVWRAAS